MIRFWTFLPVCPRCDAGFPLEQPDEIQYIRIAADSGNLRHRVVRGGQQLASALNPQRYDVRCRRHPRDDAENIPEPADAEMLHGCQLPDSDIRGVMTVNVRKGLGKTGFYHAFHPAGGHIPAQLHNQSGEKSGAGVLKPDVPHHKLTEQTGKGPLRVGVLSSDRIKSVRLNVCV